jgi:hypothetical protein
MHAVQAAQGTQSVPATQDQGQARNRQDDINYGKKCLSCCHSDQFENVKNALFKETHSILCFFYVAAVH